MTPVDATDTDGGVLITGGASGIGRAAVELFLARGWSVIAADYNAEAGERLLAELHEFVETGQLAFQRVDVADEPQVQAAVEAVAHRFGRVACVVNNAGVGGAFGPVTEIEVDDWDYTFAVLVRGVFLGIKHGARAMQMDGRGGSIINTASPAGEHGGLGPLAYSSAKAAVISLTRMAAVELAPARIRVNAVNPGLVLTPLFGKPELLAPGTALRDALPWPDFGVPNDVARVMAFLASEDAGYVTGVTMNVDGGLVAAGSRLAHGMTQPKVGVNRGTTGEKSTVRRRLA
jgi:NAD(P)-dependent dehydrogenase (short-subunit alcohol dehydrogenase family)